MWFKVDDKLHDHKKTRKARKGGDRPRDAAAMGLWVLAGSWAAGNETDGFVPEDELESWDTNGLELAQRLVDAGYWTPAEQDGETGYQFESWDEYQPTKQQLEAKREQARERMRRARGVRANDKGTSGDVRSTPTRPDPKGKTPSPADAGGEHFEAFWQQYPRKVGKAAAVKAFIKAKRSTDPQAILAGLENARQVWQATGTEPRFIPHPSTWLNEGRWADEVPLPGADKPTVGQPSRVANQCNRPDCPGHRHEWDDGSNNYLCMGA